MSNEYNEDATMMGGLFLIIAGSMYRLWPLFIFGCFLFGFGIMAEIF